jgi:hypothetical protein
LCWKATVLDLLASFFTALDHSFCAVADQSSSPTLRRYLYPQLLRLVVITSGQGEEFDARCFVLSSSKRENRISIKQHRGGFNSLYLFLSCLSRSSSSGSAMSKVEGGQTHGFMAVDCMVVGGIMVQARYQVAKHLTTSSCPHLVTVTIMAADFVPNMTFPKSIGFPPVLICIRSLTSRPWPHHRISDTTLAITTPARYCSMLKDRSSRCRAAWQGVRRHPLARKDL